METKYSKTEFEGFTHKFIVKLKLDGWCLNDINITIYSNSDSYQKLGDFLIKNKSSKVVIFSIEGRISKEQYKMSAKFIDELLGGL